MEIGKVCFSESTIFHFGAPTCEKRVNTFSYHGTGGFFLNTKATLLSIALIFCKKKEPKLIDSSPYPIICSFSAVSNSYLSCYNIT